jgi:hypothetical protein
MGFVFFIYKELFIFLFGDLEEGGGLDFKVIFSGYFFEIFKFFGSDEF